MAEVPLRRKSLPMGRGHQGLLTRPGQFRAAGPLYEKPENALTKPNPCYIRILPESGLCADGRVDTRLFFHYTRKVRCKCSAVSCYFCLRLPSHVCCGPVWGQSRYPQGHTRLMGYGLFPKIHFLAPSKVQDSRVWAFSVQSRFSRSCGCNPKAPAG